MNARETIIDWADVKSMFLAAVERGEHVTDHASMSSRYRRLHANPNEEISGMAQWEGGNGAFTLGVLRNGYKPDAFKTAAKRVPQQSKRRNRWNASHGRPSAHRVAQGDPNLFKRRQKVDRKPGIRVKVQTGFSASTDVREIEKYGTCVAGLLKNLQMQGFDITVDLWIALDRLFSDRPRNGQRENVYVRVKKPGERSDFTEWSAIFGPTGYRHLTFTAKVAAAKQLGVQASPTLGGTTTDFKYGLTYDRKSNTIEITASQRGAKFDEAAFIQQAKDAGLI